MLLTLEANHSAWAAPLRLVLDAVDHNLVVEGGATLSFVADPVLQIPLLPADDAGRISVDIQIGNDGDVLGDRFRALKGLLEKPQAALRWYSDDGVLDTGPAYFELHEPAQSGAVITASLRSRNDEDLPAQPEAFSIENTPTLRGLRT